MIWLLYCLLVVNVWFGAGFLQAIIHDSEIDQERLPGVIIFAFLTPINIIWLAQL